MAELIDEALVAQRSRELLATRQADRVAAFRDRLERLTTPGEDAAVAAAAHLARCRAALDQDAAQCLSPLTTAHHSSLDARLRELPNPSPATLESAGWSAMTDLVVDAVTIWRTAWSSRIAAAAADAAHRQQQQLDETLADVRASAWELLGVDLMADAPVLELPTGPGFAFDLAPATGWNQPVTAAVRRHLPGAPGRQRVIRFLHEEAERMLGMHIGRAGLVQEGVDRGLPVGLPDPDPPDRRGATQTRQTRAARHGGLSCCAPPAPRNRPPEDRSPTTAPTTDSRAFVCSPVSWTSCAGRMSRPPGLTL